MIVPLAETYIVEDNTLWFHAERFVDYLVQLKHRSEYPWKVHTSSYFEMMDHVLEWASECGLAVPAHEVSISKSLARLPALDSLVFVFYPVRRTKPVPES